MGSPSPLQLEAKCYAKIAGAKIAAQQGMLRVHLVARCSLLMVLGLLTALIAEKNEGQKQNRITAIEAEKEINEKSDRKIIASFAERSIP